METFGILENWSLRRGGRHQRFDRTAKITITGAKLQPFAITFSHSFKPSMDFNSSFFTKTIPFNGFNNKKDAFRSSYHSRCVNDVVMVNWKYFPLANIQE